MKILSQITPAETLLIKDCDDVQLKELMKFTFMDLLLKKVIEIKEIDKKAHPRDPYLRTYTYVVAGKNFKAYTPKNHETIFLSPFTKSPAIEILFKNFIKMVCETTNGIWSFIKSTRSNTEIKPYFKQSVLLSFFKLNKRTQDGKKLGSEIANYLNEIDNRIDHLLHNDQQQALELILNIGGNIFLLKNLDFQLLKTIDKALLNEQKVKHSDAYESDSDWWFYIEIFEDDYSFDSYFESIDDTLDAFDSEFDISGCSSCDSGCNSCGGCD
ncbi:hypothetical protein HNV08_06105 [Winogradskyella eckloniae]|uniref:hypothetical protein n=1 Tax=Winogradskyella eckloniae TaxID=1089306 RepID=UPI001566AED8|nr:hypothetical protein [Winogradskyella eckloniae]NRD19613.1 hypothetical protein [Winogradskyella eckloniae]